MSYFSLLFSWHARTQGMLNFAGTSSIAEREGFAGAETEASVRIPMGNETMESLLPTGITSMEHWLDLNA